MAHLYIYYSASEPGGQPGRWRIHPLDQPAATFTVGATLGDGAGCRPPGALLLMRSLTASGEEWLAMSATANGVRINGAPLQTGIIVLRNRDELFVEGLGSLFFSTERLPEIVCFPGAERPINCVRCGQVIESGSPAVQCASCAVWAHMSETFACWLYSDRCSGCRQQLTALGEDFRWTPEGL